jgi:hemolysin D
VIEKKAELKSAQAQVMQTQADIKSLESNRDETIAAFLIDAANQRTAALQKLASLKQQIAKDRQRENYRRLVAPINGTVQNVKIHTPGAVVAAGDTLMTIVPDDAGIEVDAQVQNMDIGFVREGQNVEIKLDAFPFTRYGLVRGKVTKLGRDSVSPGNNAPPAQVDPSNSSQSTATDLTYPAIISLVVKIERKSLARHESFQLLAMFPDGSKRLILSTRAELAHGRGREKAASVGHAGFSRNQNWNSSCSRISPVASDAGSAGGWQRAMISRPIYAAGDISIDRVILERENIVKLI